MSAGVTIATFAPLRRRFLKKCNSFKIDNVKHEAEIVLSTLETGEYFYLYRFAKKRGLKIQIGSYHNTFLISILIYKGYE